MKVFLFAVCFMACLSASAQVKFESLSLNEAIKKAEVSGKIVFAQFVSETCAECNEVADKSFEEVELGSVIEKKCVAIKIDVEDKDRQEFIYRYAPQNSFGTYFILGNGDLIHQFAITTTRSNSYSQQIDSAYNKWTEGLASLKELDEEWRSNPSNVVAMEKNLDKRRSVNLPTDSLVEVYVQRLSPDSFLSKRVLLFLANHAPAIGSQANNALRQNQDLFKMAWYSMPNQNRVQLNSRIVSKSMRKAIEKRDINLAHNVAIFQASVYDNPTDDLRKRALDNSLLNYYLGIKDTAQYLSKAVPYYDFYYMAIPVRTIKLQDSVRRIASLRNSVADTIRDPKDPNKFMRVVRNSFTSTANSYANQLSMAAWRLYTYTSDEKLLIKALTWSKRAVEFFPDPKAMDTYARLLYKTGAKDEAIEIETKAFTLQKERKYGFKRFETVLEKMKKRETKIDEYSN